ncbi:MAG: UDP-N-acetylglucosamine 2-epimerase (non-hydrolyzing) [Solirubrobacteraceae bacterium]|nr:UDP-N-acetylglucosamine 2-epimerase (non-hydrolyzing) [Solirubrobacteraceae bacterium]
MSAPHRPSGRHTSDSTATPNAAARPMHAVSHRSSVATVLSVIGARPEIIQATPVSEALRKHCREILVHTGQHYDEKMSGAQIAATKLPEPDVNLGVGSSSPEEQVRVGTERMIELINERRPDVILVRGDTSATLAGALAAERTGVPLVHVEAGLRSHRHDMPEEYNRVETDKRSDLLLAPVPGAVKNLQAERVHGEIFMTGDPLCDILEGLRDQVLPAGGDDYLLATVHRNYNTDDKDRLQGVLDCLARSPWTVRWPLHPRTAAAIDKFGLALPENVEVLEPVTYTQMLSLERGAQAIATDSGGVQREAYLWGVPCITLREETEWTDTVDQGWNTLVGVDDAKFQAALDAPRPDSRPAIFGDGHASERIAEHTIALARKVNTAGPTDLPNEDWVA